MMCPIFYVRFYYEKITNLIIFCILIVNIYGNVKMELL